MRWYGMGYQAVMDMPVRAFWTISGFVERLQAWEGQLQLEVAAASHSGEAAETMFKRLKEQAPDPVKLTGAAIVAKTAVRDEKGFAELRQMAG